MNQFIKTLFLLLALVTTTYAQLSVQLDSSSVALGQTFRLTLIDDNPGTRERPDLTPLQTNFTVMGTEQMANYTVINGQAHSLNQWVLLLTPKHTGVLKIPAIAIGQEKTPESEIEVTGTSSQQQQQQQDTTIPAVKFVTNVSELKPYVNQQVIYTVKLYIHRRLLDADYQPPQVKDALMVALGKPRRYQTTEHGIPYTVEELQYAFFPQKSGDLTITPPQFHALVFDAIPGNVQIAAKTTVLNVQAAKTGPDNISWLPAKKVSLQEKYDNPSTSLEQGSMIVRTITLSATGAAAQLLPKLSFETNDQFSVYPEKPTEETHYQRSNLQGVVTMNITYLFNKPGSITIPALKLPWFNTVSGHVEEAVLPARTLQVSASTTPATSTPTASSEAHPTPSLATPFKKPSAPVPSLAPKSTPQHPALAWFVAAGFALAWLITLLLWWYSRREHAGRALRKARKRVRLACRRHDPSEAKDALMDWATKQWPEASCMSLGDLASLVDSPPLKKAINTLSQQLYQNRQQEWHGDDLERHFAAYQPQRTPPLKAKKVPLPPINP